MFLSIPFSFKNEATGTAAQPRSREHSLSLGNTFPNSNHNVFIPSRLYAASHMMIYGIVHSFPRTAVTNYHIPNSVNVFPLNCEEQKPRVKVLTVISILDVLTKKIFSNSLLAFVVYLPLKVI